MKTTMHLKVDKDIKDRSAKLAGRLGLSLSTVVNASLRNFVKTETFSVSAGETMTPYMESWLAEIEKDKRMGKNVSGPFRSIAELKAHLSR
jgi:antitoxin component of RelBE/YafQ-DinJ toxin-antitoxin module